MFDERNADEGCTDGTRTMNVELEHDRYRNVRKMVCIFQLF